MTQKNKSRCNATSTAFSKATKNNLSPNKRIGASTVSTNMNSNMLQSTLSDKLDVMMTNKKMARSNLKDA